MTISRWLLQVYEMSDLPAQESALSLLSSMPGLTVDVRTCERGSYLIVDCADPSEAMAVYELVVMADSRAELIHSVTSPDEVQAIRVRLASEDGSGQPTGRDLLDA